jgi:hypothetical protein
MAASAMLAGVLLLPYPASAQFSPPRGGMGGGIGPGQIVPPGQGISPAQRGPSWVGPMGPSVGGGLQPPAYQPPVYQPPVYRGPAYQPPAYQPPSVENNRPQVFYPGRRGTGSGASRPVGPYYPTHGGHNGTAPSDGIVPPRFGPVGVFPPTTSSGDGHHRHHGGGYYGGGYYGTGFYGGGLIVSTDSPALLGGYYYGNYCDTYFGANTYPAIYGDYEGFPQYIYNPGVIVLGQPYTPSYVTPYLPFFAPAYPVGYGDSDYYVGSPERVAQVEEGGAPAQQALRNAYPDDSFQAAFGDIERAWRDGNIALIRKHIRDNDTKISVAFKSKYSYSIASGDFVQITRDAFDRLNTVSFEFTRLRKAKNGDVTAYGKHVYRVAVPESADNTGDTGSAAGSGTTGDGAQPGQTVPFSTGQPASADQSNTAGGGTADQDKTVYVSYTLRHGDGQWYIIAIDSSPADLATPQDSGSDSAPVATPTSSQATVTPTLAVAARTAFFLLWGTL